MLLSALHRIISITIKSLRSLLSRSETSTVAAPLGVFQCSQPLTFHFLQQSSLQSKSFSQTITEVFMQRVLRVFTCMEG